jgi:hypothetical protein
VAAATRRSLGMKPRDAIGYSMAPVRNARTADVLPRLDPELPSVGGAKAPSTPRQVCRAKRRTSGQTAPGAMRRRSADLSMWMPRWIVLTGRRTMTPSRDNCRRRLFHKQRIWPRRGERLHEPPKISPTGSDHHNSRNIMKIRARGGEWRRAVARSGGFRPETARLGAIREWLIGPWSV